MTPGIHATNATGTDRVHRGDDEAQGDLAVLAAVIKGLSDQVAALVARQPTQRALSKRAAAQLLGISRGRTLDRLIQSGAIRTVPIGTRNRIPLSEVERILAEGAPESRPGPQLAVRPRAARPQTRPPPDIRLELAKARAIKITDL